MSSYQSIGPAVFQRAIAPGSATASARIRPPATTATAAAPVRAAIAQAAQKTGVDFDYLLAQAKLESGLDPSARARTSSATGLYQFTSSTWLSTLDRHAADHGLEWAGAAIEGGAVRDPAMRAQIMALRADPQLASLMAGELANDNAAYLAGVLGRAPDHAELYLAHFLGADGAGRFLGALAADPGQSAAAVLPQAAAANRPIFFGAGGAARSVGEVMDLLRTRLTGAMEGGDAAMWAAALPGGGFAPGAMPAPAQAPTGGPIAQEFAAAASAGGNRQGFAAGTSMADTLRDAFALGGGGAGSSGAGGAAPDHVRAAYGRLRAMGM